MFSTEHQVGLWLQSLTYPSERNALTDKIDAVLRPPQLLNEIFHVLLNKNRTGERFKTAAAVSERMRRVHASCSSHRGPSLQPVEQRLHPPVVCDDSEVKQDANPRWAPGGGSGAGLGFWGAQSPPRSCHGHQPRLPKSPSAPRAQRCAWGALYLGGAQEANGLQVLHRLSVEGVDALEEVHLLLQDLRLRVHHAHHAGLRDRPAPHVTPGPHT